MIEKLVFKQEPKHKTAFYASDYGKSSLDLYFAFTGEPITNPPNWYDTLKWGAGNGVEAAMLKVLKDSDIVEENYNQKEHGRVEMMREGIVIHGYIDALSKGGRPIEIKSVNNKNDFDIKKYERGYPRESYVGQLATYLEFTQAKDGVLFVSSIDGLHHYWLPCIRIRKGVYRCGNVVVDINAEYKRWSRIYHDNVQPRVMPDVWEKRYKFPVESIDWRKQSQSAITKARNGHAVIGDWEISWSPWKNRIIELQGTVPGYTADELDYIHAQTKGYTSWFKKGKKAVDNSLEG